MTFKVRVTGFALLLAFLILPAAMAFAATDFMSVDQLKPGMRGIAKTVVSGTRIEDFNVEILGIMKNKGPSGDLILIRTSGDLIDRTGGIAQGMSGSPVYINGKLIGAIAYGWSFTDHRTGMVTPIADMLKLWNIADSKKVAPDDSIGGQLLKESTPLMAAGFSDGALAMLKDKLGPLNLVPYAVGDAPDGTAFGPLKPGSSVGVQLVRGDVSLGAIGTVTYVDGDKLLAFGHPFLKKGDSGYFLTDGYIFTTVNGIDSSFKVGTTGPTVGVINQDRGAGIAGELGKEASCIPMHITVQDTTMGLTRNAEVQVVQDEQLSPILAATAVFSEIEKTIDRVGSGTARVSFELSARNMPGTVFKRQNMFYSDSNIDELAVSEINELLTLLASNQFQPVDVLDLKVNVAVDAAQRTATIMQAASSTLTAKPGDKICIAVNLKPYRSEPVIRTVSFTIPADQAPGPLTLEVRGGGTVPLIELLKRQVTDSDVLKLVDKLKTQTFDDLLKGLAERDHNNDIVVEPMNPDGTGADGSTQVDLPSTDLEPGENSDQVKHRGNADNKKPEVSTAAKLPDANVKGVLSTDYIVDSDTQIVINVTNADGSDPNARL